MVTVGIMANGPTNLLPDLTSFKNKIDVWIGADRGAVSLIKNKIAVDYAIGDFDSTDFNELNAIRTNAKHLEKYPSEKDETDLELALNKAFQYHTDTIYLFGVTGGRLDHTLVNIQSLYQIVLRGIEGILIDHYNQIELLLPGEYTVSHEKEYPNLSFIPLTPVVKGLTLKGFYYPLTRETIMMGSTLCISNKLLSNKGTFLFDEGILLLVKSCD